jgi:hypothetical protein
MSVQAMIDGLKTPVSETRLNVGPMRVDKDSRRIGETVEFRNRRVKTRAKSKAARAARKQGRK